MENKERMKVEFQFKYTHECDKKKIKNSNLEGYINILNKLKNNNNNKNKTIMFLKNKYDKLVVNQKIVYEEEIPDLNFNELPSNKVISLRMQQLKVYMSNINKLIINKLSVELKNLLNLTNKEIEKEKFKKKQYDNKIKFIEDDLRLRKKQISRNDFLINFQNIYFNENELKSLNNFIRIDKNSSKYKMEKILNKNNYLGKKRNNLKNNLININEKKEKYFKEYIELNLLIKNRSKDLIYYQNQLEEYNDKKNMQKKLKENNEYIDKLLNIFKEVHYIVNLYQKENEGSYKKILFEEKNSNFKIYSSKKTQKNNVKDDFFKNLNKINKKLGCIFNKLNNNKKIIKTPNTIKLPNFYKNINKSKEINDNKIRNSYNEGLPLKKKDDISEISTIVDCIMDYYSNLMYIKQSLKNRYENLLFQKNKQYLKLIELNKQSKKLSNIKKSKIMSVQNFIDEQNKFSSFEKIKKYLLLFKKNNVMIFKSITFLNDLLYKFYNILNYIFNIDNIIIENKFKNLIKKVYFKLKNNKNNNINVKISIFNLIDKYFYDESWFGLKSFWKYFFKSNIHLFYFITNDNFEKLIKEYLEEDLNWNNNISKKYSLNNKRYSSLLFIKKDNEIDGKELVNFQKNEVLNSFMDYFIQDSLIKINIEINELFILYKEIINKLYLSTKKGNITKYIIIRKYSTKDLIKNTKIESVRIRDKFFSNNSKLESSIKLKNIKSEKRKNNKNINNSIFITNNSLLNKTNYSVNSNSDLNLLNKYKNYSKNKRITDKYLENSKNTFNNHYMINYKKNMIHDSTYYSKFKHLIKSRSKSKIKLF